MSFFSKGNRGKGRRPNDFWGNKRLYFSIHFDAKSEEFNQFLQAGFLNLAGQGAFQPHPPLERPPLQPICSIFGIHVQTHVSLPPEC